MKRTNCSCGLGSHHGLPHLPRIDGEVMEFEAHGKLWVVRKKQSGSYTLRADRGGRVRWGNAQEIRKDMRHVVDYGVLPQESRSMAGLSVSRRRMCSGR